MSSLKTIYICGKMRSMPKFNFPAFDTAAKLGRSLDYIVINPAEMDRQDPKDFDTLSMLDRQRIYARRDLDAIFKCTHIALLPGWESSIGATTEACLGRWLGLEFVDATTFEPLDISKHYFTNKAKEELV